MLSEIIWSDKYNHHTFVISSCLESNVKKCLLEHIIGKVLQPLGLDKGCEDIVL